MSEDNGAGLPEKSADYLMGEVRDALLMQVRSMETPWSKLSEDEQADRIAAITATAESTVRRAAHAIAKSGFDHVPVIIKDFTVKGGAIKGKFEALVSEPNVIRLSDHQETAAVIVLVDHERYMGAETEAKPDPQEPELPMGEEDQSEDAAA